MVFDDKEVLNGIEEINDYSEAGQVFGRQWSWYQISKGRPGMARQKKVGIWELAPLLRIRG